MTAIATERIGRGGGAGIALRAGAGRHPGWVAWFIFAGLLIWLWPRRVIVRGDDFGYIESVVEMIRHGALNASDWLGPLNFVLPVVSAALWRLSGSFYVATFGLAAAIALTNFWLMWRWLRCLLPAGLAGSLTVLGVALSPVILNKTVEFTGVPLGLTFFLGTLLAWRSRVPWLFFPLVLIGFMNRQSAACLLALPAVDLFRAWFRGERIDRRWAVGIAGTAAIIVLIALATPANFARLTMAQHQAENNLLKVGGQILLGTVLLGGAAAGWACLRGEPGLGAGRAILRKPVPMLAWLILGVMLTLSGITIRCETPWMWRLGPVIVVAASVAAALVPDALRRVAPEAWVAAGAYGFLVAWHGVWWDYYFCEPALLIAFTRVQPDGSESRPLARWCGLALLSLALLWLYPLRWQLRWAETRVVAYEEALRAGRIGVSEASGAPFGFLGWKVFPALREHASEPGLGLGDFVKFVEAGRSFYAGGTIVAELPDPERRSLHGSGELWPLPAGYRPRRFPLNDAEWRDWLASSAP